MPLTEDITEWYSNLSGTWKLILIMAFFVVVGLVLLYLLGSLDIDIGKGTGLPSLLETSPGLPSLLTNATRLPSLISFGEKEAKLPTIENVLCTYIYDYNMTNMTIGNINATQGRTTCYKLTGNKCMCVTNFA